MTFCEMSLQNAMSELIKLVEKITDGHIQLELVYDLIAALVRP